MSLPSKDPHPAAGTESGAWAAWGLIGGALAGALIGLAFHEARMGALILGVIGWIGGALYDRSRK
ncbi:MAG: hypothetical protein HZC55_08660 [Verrucomicrobia bacterium]|nr:hypothetical protein [Verrucomicrobiota bacterium]